jgi:hemerythrin-like domain-containing protein
LIPIDPFDMLEADHRSVAAMLEALSDSEPGPERAALVDKLTTAFEAHATYEDAAIYPFVPEVMDAEKEEEAEIEHGLAREGTKKLNEMVSLPGFGAAVEMLEGGITHHVEEEESEMFPALRKALDDDTKARLLNELRESKSAAGLPLMDPDVATKDEFLHAAADAGIEGRSTMSKDQLVDALGSIAAE